MGKESYVIQNIKTGMPLFSHTAEETIEPLLITASLSAIQRVLNFLTPFTYLARIVLTNTADQSMISLNSIFKGDYVLTFSTEGIPTETVIHFAQDALAAFLRQFKPDITYIDLEDYSDFSQDFAFQALNSSINSKAKPTTGKVIIPLAGISSIGMTTLFSQYLPPWILNLYHSYPNPRVSDKSFFDAKDRILLQDKVLDKPASLLLSIAHVARAFSALFGDYDSFTLFVPSENDAYFLSMDPSEDLNLLKNQESTPGFGILFLVKETASSYNIDPYQVFPKVTRGLRNVNPKILLHTKQFLDGNIHKSLKDILSFITQDKANRNPEPWKEKKYVRDPHTKRRERGW